MGILRQRTFRPFSVLTAVALLAAIIAPLAVASDRAAATALPAYRFTRSFDTSAPGYVTSRGTATDSQGNVYVTGYYSGTVTFGGSDTFTNNNGNAFLTKFSNDGDYLWTRKLDISASGSYSLAYGVAVDSNDDAYITGYIGGTVTLGGSDTYNGGTNWTAYVAKFASDGTYGWGKALDASAGGARAEGDAIAVSPLGDVYMTGKFHGNVTFGGSDTLNGGTNGNAFLVRYDSDGTYGWTKAADVSASGTFATGIGVSTDSAGNAYVGGSFGGGTVVFGATDSINRTSTTGFLSKYASDGTYGWTKADTSAGGAWAIRSGVASGADGAIYTSGTFAGSATFGDSTTLNGSAGSAYISKYDSDGTYGWTKALDTSASGASANGYAVAADSAGNAYLTGKFIKSVVFGGTETIASTNTTAFVTQYGGDGSYGWTKRFDTSASGATATSMGVASDTFGNIFIFGDSSGTVTTDTGGSVTGSYNGFLVSYEAFVPPAEEGGSPGGGTPATIPNNGDANGDGVQDSTQTSIAGTTNASTNAYSLVQAGSGCTIGGLSIAKESALSAADNGYSYPAGLANFTVSGCGAPGYTTTITQYHYGVNSSGFVLRKFNGTTKKYDTITGAAISTVTIGGQSVVKATYQVTDGGTLDEDGAVNGVIVDPAGLAFAATPATGLGAPQKTDAITAVLASLAALSVLAGLAMNRRRSADNA